MDAERLRASFARVAGHGDQVPLYFFSRLFLAYPTTADMFPVSMAAQRKRFVRALIKIVSEVDRADQLTPYLQRLGRDHRKFGAVAGHYEPVGAVLLATLEHFCGDMWDEGLAADWTEAYGVIAGIMTAAAAEDEQHAPASWQGTVISADRPAPDVVILRVATEPPMTWLPGQYVTVETRERPREWRRLCPANLPGDEAVELHVRVLGRGGVSDALAAAGPGVPLRIGPAAGDFTLSGTDGNLLLAAGSTGIAPVKAIIRRLAETPAPPAVVLLYGAARADGLYDLEALQKLAARCPWLAVIPCTADGPLEQVIAQYARAAPGAWLAGPRDMIAACTSALAAAGMPAERIRIQDFGWTEPWNGTAPTGRGSEQ